MAKVIDETGQRYGRLLVIERAGNMKGGEATWLCRCDCGNVREVRGSRLRNGVRSCSCRCKLSNSEAAFNALFSRMKNIAKHRKHKWALSKEEFQWLTSQCCFYCGIEPYQGAQSVRQGKTKYSSNYIYNGLDRVDNTKGYTRNNVVPCCGNCNKAKNDRTLLEFTEWVHRVSEWLNQKEGQYR